MMIMLYLICFRSTIEQLYPERLKQRITSLNDDPNNKAVIKQFDEALHRPTEVNPQLQLTMQALQQFIARFNPGNNQVDRQLNPAVEERMKTLICYGGWGVMIAMLVIAVSSIYMDDPEYMYILPPLYTYPW